MIFLAGLLTGVAIGAVAVLAAVRAFARAIDHDMRRVTDFTTN